MRNLAENNRGREAVTPTEIPVRGWRDIFRRVKHKVAEDNLSIITAGVAFYGFLAIFPTMAALVSMFGLITSPVELQTYLHTAENFLPSEAMDLIRNELPADNRCTGKQARLGRGVWDITWLMERGEGDDCNVYRNEWHV